MNPHLRFLLAVLSGAGLALAGCGRPEAPSTAAVPADGRRAIELTANDSMKFNLTELHAKPGEALRITLRNTGQMPKQAMAHNWVLLKSMSEAELNAFGLSASAKAPDYMPADRSAVLAATKLVGARESDTIEITAPATPGEYPFLCTFPGHFAIMKGKLIVE
jgi:azurin